LLQQSGTYETDKQLAKDHPTDKEQSENDQNDLEKSEHAQSAGSDESAVQMSEGVDGLSAMEKHFGIVDKLDNVQQADAQADLEQMEQQVVGNDVGNAQSSVGQAEDVKNTEEVLPEENGQLSYENEQEPGSTGSDHSACESGQQAGSSGDQPACASPEKPAEQNHAGEAVSGLAESSLPESGLPESGLPENGLPENGLPENGLHESGLPESGASESGLPESGLPGSVLPEGSKAAPEFTLAKESTTKVPLGHPDNTGTGTILGVAPVCRAGTVTSTVWFGRYRTDSFFSARCRYWYQYSLFMLVFYPLVFS
jgi:hypothetical protein